MLHLQWDRPSKLSQGKEIQSWEQLNNFTSVELFTRWLISVSARNPSTACHNVSESDSWTLEVIGGGSGLVYSSQSTLIVLEILLLVYDIIVFFFFFFQGFDSHLLLGNTNDCWDKNDWVNRRKGWVIGELNVDCGVKPKQNAKPHTPCL